jgi:hypothetical protein
MSSLIPGVYPDDYSPLQSRDFCHPCPGCEFWTDTPGEPCHNCQAILEEQTRTDNVIGAVLIIAILAILAVVLYKNLLLIDASPRTAPSTRTQEIRPL